MAILPPSSETVLKGKLKNDKNPQAQKSNKKT
jgi:hypothetical protein